MLERLEEVSKEVSLAIIHGNAKLLGSSGGIYCHICRVFNGKDKNYKVLKINTGGKKDPVFHWSVHKNCYDGLQQVRLRSDKENPN